MYVVSPRECAAIPRIGGVEIDKVSKKVCTTLCCCCTTVFRGCGSQELVLGVESEVELYRPEGSASRMGPSFEVAALQGYAMQRSDARGSLARTQRITRHR